MTTRPDRLLLLDTASLYFRAFYGVPESITAPDGTPVNAVRGLLDFVARLVTDLSPTRFVACLDASWRPDFRTTLLPSYKGHRVAADGAGEEVPAALAPQVPVIVDVLEALGLAHFGVVGFEADDVIGTLATAADCAVDVVSGDRDMFQLVDDARAVRVLYTARGVGKHEVVTESVVTAKYAIPGTAYADFASLRGDPSDGLPGVAGIGDKTAATLITRFGTLGALMTALDDPASDVAGPVRRKLDSARDYLAVAPDVVEVRKDVPLPPYDDTLPVVPADPERLLELVDRWGLSSSVNRVLVALQNVAAG